MSCRILITDYDQRWPELFRREAERIGGVLGRRALRIEHVGSTSVPGLAAKPVIDVLLEVADSGQEGAYAPLLEAAEYVLHIREPDWRKTQRGYFSLIALSVPLAFAMGISVG